MKVSLDLDKLLREGEISQREYDKLIELSQKETKSYAFSIFVVLAIISVVIGTVGLFREFFMELGKMLLDLLGANGLHMVAILSSGAGALLAGSGVLAALCAFGILTFLGNAGLFYTHATYWVFIEEPAKTVILFSLLAWLTYVISGRLMPRHQRVTIIFSRTCVFIVNMAFWIGSLWGDKLHRDIPDVAFAVVWALALVGLGAWAAIENKRWVVNTAAIFGSIHFYTQWFERLGASPASLIAAGLIALGILYGLRAYNRNQIWQGRWGRTLSD